MHSYKVTYWVRKLDDTYTEYSEVVRAFTAEDAAFQFYLEWKAGNRAGQARVEIRRIQPYENMKTYSVTYVVEGYAASNCDFVEAENETVAAQLVRSKYATVRLQITEVAETSR